MDYVSYGSKAVLERLAVFGRKLKEIRKSENAAGIHDFRVAARRLRAALETFSDLLPPRLQTKLLKSAAKTARALNRVRDLDVQISISKNYSAAVANAAEKKLFETSAKQREKFREKALTTINAVPLTSLLQQSAALLCSVAGGVKTRRKYPPLEQRAGEAAAELRDNFLDALRQAEKKFSGKRLHALRIAAKRLRYALEIFAPLSAGGQEASLKRLREIQGILGHLNDLNVMLENLTAPDRKNRFAGLPGLLKYVRKRRRKELSRLKRFLPREKSFFPPETSSSFQQLQTAGSGKRQEKAETGR